MRHGVTPYRHATGASANGQKPKALVTRNLAQVMVGPEASLLEALQVIDRSGYEIALVCDREGRVLGTLTDGDVRRAFLRGAALDSCCLPQTMRRDFTSVGAEASRTEVLDLMRARGISQVPVVDCSKRLIGLHLLRDFVSNGELPNWVVLIAGGKGERLRPLTDSLPKPMITVAGRPILERLVLHLVGLGLRRFFISIGHLGHLIEDHFDDGARFGCRIEYLRERRPLGTAGPLSLLREVPRHPVLVMNGDLVTQVDVRTLLSFHERGGFSATMGVKVYGVQIPFGVVDVRGTKLMALEEKPTHRMLVNAGMYVLSPNVLKLLRRGGHRLMTEVFDGCLRRNLKVGAHVIEADWIDVGRSDELRLARGEL